MRKTHYLLIHIISEHSFIHINHKHPKGSSLGTHRSTSIPQYTEGRGRNKFENSCPIPLIKDSIKYVQTKPREVGDVVLDFTYDPQSN